MTDIEPIERPAPLPPPWWAAVPAVIAAALIVIVGGLAMGWLLVR